MTLTLIQPVSNWTHWATLRRHPCLSRAATSASSQVNPIFRRSLLYNTKIREERLRKADCFRCEQSRPTMMNRVIIASLYYSDYRSGALALPGRHSQL